METAGLPTFVFVGDVPFEKRDVGLIAQRLASSPGWIRRRALLHGDQVVAGDDAHGELAEVHELRALDHGIEGGIDRELNGLSALVPEVQAVRVTPFDVESSVCELSAQRRHVDRGRDGEIDVERGARQSGADPDGHATDDGVRDAEVGKRPDGGSDRLEFVGKIRHGFPSATCTQRMLAFRREIDGEERVRRHGLAFSVAWAAMTLDRRTRLPLALLVVLVLVCVATAWAPPSGRQNWALEVVPGLLLVAYMVATYRRMPLSNVVYVGTFLHVLVLVYGGYYSYANTPLGDWARDAFGLSRNHYDRVGHFALGFFPALFTREVLLRKTPLRPGGWLAFLAWSVVFAIGAFWELVEWWTTLLVASDLGQAFLGSQGDVWDAQWDMFFVGVGALVALGLFSGIHQRSMAHVTR